MTPLAQFICILAIIVALVDPLFGAIVLAIAVAIQFTAQPPPEQ